MALFITSYKVASNFESVDEILQCYHPNESYGAVLTCGAVYYAVRNGSEFDFVTRSLKCCHSNES